MRTIATFGMAAMLLLPAQAAMGDTVTLKDGSRREGKIIEKTAEGVTLEITVGNMKTKVFIAAAQIQSVEEKELAPGKDELEVKKRKDTVGASRNAADWLALARFLETVPGYAEDAKKAYEKAIDLEPDNAEARRQLGYTRDKQGRWKAEGASMRAVGLVRSGDDWMTPQERSLRIDRKQSQSLGLRIGPSKEDLAPSVAQQREVALKAAEQEVALRNYYRLAYGESLLGRLGYYDGFSVGLPYPYAYEGTYLSNGQGELFVGGVGLGYSSYGSCGWPYSSGVWNVTGPVPLWFERGGWATLPGGGYGGYGYSSPGLIYRSGDNAFSFGTNFGGSGYSGYGGWGLNFSRSTKNYSLNIGLGGSSWSGGGFGGTGWSLR